jgi:hypothetical protein
MNWSIDEKNELWKLSSIWMIILNDVTCNLNWNKLDSNCIGLNWNQIHWTKSKLN